MAGKRAVGVTPQAAYHDYVDENLEIVEYDSDQMRPGCEQEFKAAANLEEGVAGLRQIDTTYENYSVTTADSVRSDTEKFVATNRHPAPHDIARSRYPQRQT